jgi:hypothetical protein
MELLWMCLGVDENEMKDVLDICKATGLLVVENETIYSPSLKERMRSMDENRLKRQESGRLGGNATAMLKQCSSNAAAMLKHKSRVDKSRVDKIRGDNTHTLSPAATSFVKPTIEEVKAYCVERSNTVDADKWFDYYQSNGWRVGRNAMKDWRAAVRTWEKSSFEKKTPYQETVEAGKRYLAKVKQQEDYVKSTDIDPRVKSLISGI